MPRQRVFPTPSTRIVATSSVAGLATCIAVGVVLALPAPAASAPARGTEDVAKAAPAREHGDVPNPLAGRQDWRHHNGVLSCLGPLGVAPLRGEAL